MRKKENKLSMTLHKIKEERTTYLMLLPNLIMFVVFTIYPIAWALSFMFYEYKGFGEKKWIGIDNFIRIFTRDHDFWDSVIHTLEYVGLKLIYTLPLALLLAVLLQKSCRRNSVAQSVIFMPTIMSQAVMALIFYLIFNTYNGSANQYLQSLGIINQPINWLGVNLAMVTVIIVAVWGGIGNYMIYFIAGLTGIGEEIYESARVDGAGDIRIFFSITLPMLAPVLKMILMLALVISFMDYQSIMVLTGGGPLGATNVMFLYVYQLFFPISPGSRAPQEFGYGAAVSLVCAAIVGIFVGIYLILARRLDNLTE